MSRVVKPCEAIAFIVIPDIDVQPSLLRLPCDDIPVVGVAKDGNVVVGATAKDLSREAAEGHNKRTASYLLGEPLVSDYLAEGLDAFGETWTDERTTPV